MTDTPTTNPTMPEAEHKAGFVAIAGKPNAGKSTLMNALIGAELSIITPKAQTTRHRIMGIHSDEDCQIVFYDTPGLIEPEYHLHKAMMKAVDEAVKGADLLVYIHDIHAGTLLEKERAFLQVTKLPKLIVLNKIDLLDQVKLTERMHEDESVYAETLGVLPISAMENIGVAGLLGHIKEALPAGPAFYPKDQLSEQPERFFVAELIREQIFLQYQQEIPYSCTVDIRAFEEDHKPKPLIDAEIVVSSESQKKIIIGKGGTAIKKLGIAARKRIEHMLGYSIMLKLFVKIRKDWRDKPNFVKSYGY